MATAAQYRASKKYNAKVYEEIKVRVKKGEKDIIRVKASETGESVNSYINRAIEYLMKSKAVSNSQPSTDTSACINDLFSPVELKKITALLENNQTIESYIRSCLLEKINQAQL